MPSKRPGNPFFSTEDKPPDPRLSRALDYAIVGAVLFFGGLMVWRHPQARGLILGTAEKAFHAFAPRVPDQAPPKSVPPPIARDLKRFPDFTLQDVEGQFRGFQEMRADRPAVVYLYSAMCGHCEKQLPVFSGTVRGLDKRGYSIVGVQYMGTPQGAVQARQRWELPGELLADSDGKVCGSLGVGEFTVFLLDPDGFIRFRGGPEGLPGALETMN